MSRGMPNLSRLQRQAYHCFQQGELDRAERLCAGILAYRPDDFDALHLLGMLHFQRHRLVEALRFLARALKVNSSSADALSNLGLALHATGRYDEAISSYRHALDLAPDHPEILYNLGNAYLALDNADDALSNYDHVLAIAPGHVGALVNRGNALLRLNQPVKAMASYDAALASLPGHPQILTNRGHALRRLDKPVEALAEFRAALAAAPEFPEAHFEAAMAQLSMGDFDAGWKEYEWRWKTGAFARHPPPPKAPLWLGEVPISGKTILLHAEQGFGDTLQFIRYAPLLAGQGAKVICEVQPELLPLLSENVTLKGHHIYGCRRVSSGIRPALSLAQSSPGVRDAARDHPCCGSLSRRLRGAAGLLARSPAAGAPARRICLVRPVVAQERQQPLDRAAAPVRIV